MRAHILAMILAAAARPAFAQDDAPAAAWRLSIAPSAGVQMLDSHLADYRWDTSLSTRPGVAVGVQHARFGASLRTAWTGTSQSTGLIGDTGSLDVHMTQLDLALDGRVASWRNIEVWGSAHGGRMFLGYEPGELTVDAGGAPVTVQFDPVTEWCYGLGIAFRRAVARHLALGLQLDGTSFRLDTAHRSGDEIVEAREGFTNWSLSLALLGFMDLDQAP